MSFGLNVAKGFLGKNVNLHLKDGSVIVNVRLTGIKKHTSGRKRFIEYVPFGNFKVNELPLQSVAWAESLSALAFLHST
ncbi:MAG: hypothetical protein QXU99_00655 [Candidatus Bathyarchaeia archaeon]